MKRTAATLIVGAGLALPTLTACDPAPISPFIGSAVTVENTTTTTVPTRTVHGRAYLANSCTWVVKQDADGSIRARWEDGRQAPCDPDNFDPFGYLNDTGWVGP